VELCRAAAGVVGRQRDDMQLLREEGRKEGDWATGAAGRKQEIEIMGRVFQTSRGRALAQSKRRSRLAASFLFLSAPVPKRLGEPALG